MGSRASNASSPSARYRESMHRVCPQTEQGEVRVPRGPGAQAITEGPLAGVVTCGQFMLHQKIQNA